MLVNLNYNLGCIEKFLNYKTVSLCMNVHIFLKNLYCAWTSDPEYG